MPQHHYDLSGQLIVGTPPTDAITLALSLPDGEPAPDELRLTRAQRSTLFYFLNPSAPRPAARIVNAPPAIQVTPPSPTEGSPPPQSPSPVASPQSPITRVDKLAPSPSEWIGFWKQVTVGDKDGYAAACAASVDFFGKTSLSWHDPVVREMVRAAERAGVIAPGIFPPGDASLGSGQRDLLGLGYGTGGNFAAAAMMLSPGAMERA